MILSILIYLFIVLYTFAGIFYLILNKAFAYSVNLSFILFLIGFFLYYFFRTFIKKIRDFLLFLEVFQHELTHTIFTFLTFNKVYSFHSTIKSGGNIKTNRINPIIVLSPYTIPLYTIIFLILFIIVKPMYYNALAIFVGLSFAQYIYTTLNDLFFTRQTDLHVYNAFFSYMLVLICLIFYILYLYLGFNHSLSIFIDIPQFFYNQIKI